MADLPLELPDPTLVERLARALDTEGKIPRALEALGPIAGRDVVLVDAGSGTLARQLVALGARLTVLERGARVETLAAALADLVAAGKAIVGPGEPSATGLPADSADVMIAGWTAFRGPDRREMAEADRVLRPGGRLLVLHDYGRDDVSRFHRADRPEYGAWSHRGGPFLAAGFRIRVVHCWWTFASPEEASSLVCAAFGASGEVLPLTKPRLSYNLAIYHRTKGEKGEPAA